MLISVIALFLSLIVSFYVLSKSAEEVELGIRQSVVSDGRHASIGEIKKNMLSYVRRTIHVIVLITAKYWYTFTTRTTKFIMNKWPKVYGFLEKKEIKEPVNKSLNFLDKTIRDGKIKVKRLRDRIRAEHDM